MITARDRLLLHLALLGTLVAAIAAVAACLAVPA